MLVPEAVLAVIEGSLNSGSELSCLHLSCAGAAAKKSVIQDSAMATCSTIGL